MPATPVADETSGAAMLYSSGTTGRPKGVRAPLSGQPIDTPNRPDRAGFDVLRHQRGFDLSLARAALSCRAAALFDDLPAPRRDRRRDGAFRCGGRARNDREVQGDGEPVGADHVRAHAEAARRGPREIRRVVDEIGDPRGRAMPDRRQAPDDRMVGAGAARILRRHRRQRHVLREQHRLARPSRHGRASDPGRGPHLRRERRGNAGRRGGHDLFRRRDRLPLSQRSEEDGGVAPSRASRTGRRSAMSESSMRKAISISPTARPS